MSSSTVDRDVGALRRHLGVHLFGQAAQDMSLARTNSGLCRQLHPTFSRVRVVLSRVGSFHLAPAKALGVGTTQMTTHVFLVPLLINFAHRCPSVGIRLAASSSLISVIRRNFSTNIQLDNVIRGSVVDITVNPPIGLYMTTAPRCFTECNGPHRPRSLLGRRYIIFHCPDNGPFR